MEASTSSQMYESFINNLYEYDEQFDTVSGNQRCENVVGDVRFKGTFSREIIEPSHNHVKQPLAQPATTKKITAETFVKDLQRRVGSHPEVKRFFIKNIFEFSAHLLSSKLSHYIAINNWFATSKNFLKCVNDAKNVSSTLPQKLACS